MLQRLEIGLADEGVRVLHAIPGSARERPGGEGPDGGDAAVVYSTPVTYHDRGLPFTLPLRLSALLTAMEAAAPWDLAAGERPVDLVYALGQSAWPMALALCRRARAAPLIEVWSNTLVSSAVGHWRRAMAGALSGDEAAFTRRLAPMFLAPMSGLAAELGRQLPAGRVMHVPWGVHPGDDRARVIDPAGGLNIAILATGRQPAAVDAAVRALGVVAEKIPGLLVFADATLGPSLKVWKSGAADGPMATRLNVIADLEAHRELVIQADVLLIPEPLGELRSLVLDAMAAGMLVIAAADPLADHLVDGQTAITVPKPTADALAGAIFALAFDPARAAGLRLSAAKYIHDHRAASAQVRQLLAALDRLHAARAANQ